MNQKSPKPPEHHIYLLASAKTDGLRERQRSVHPFLPQINSSFAAYETPSGDAIYRIFEQDFLLTARNKKEIEAEYKGCTPLNRKIVAINQDGFTDETISRSLRGSTTLRIDESNRFITNRDVQIVFSPHGLHLSRAKLWKDRSKDQGIWVKDAEKIIDCYLLALAYQKKADALLQDAITALDNKHQQKMIDARDALCAFDLKYFFTNPVCTEIFETHAIWDMVAQHCGVKNTHDEIKNQLFDLATIIENRRRDAEEARQRRVERKLTFIGLLLSALSLVELVKSFW